MDRVAYYLCYYYYFIDYNKKTLVKNTLMLNYCVLMCLCKAVGNPCSNNASKRTVGLSPQLWH